MASMTPNPLDWTDHRPLVDLVFADGKEPNATNVRITLAAAGVVVAEDIALLGCTGLFGKLFVAQGFSASAAINTCAFVRKNMGGAGLGLTCFIGSDRYCLIHDTIGGLEKGQAQRHAEHVPAISRDLSDKERGHIALVEAVRRTKGGSNVDRIVKSMDMLAGEKLPAGFETGSAADADVESPAEIATRLGVFPPALDAMSGDAVIDLVRAGLCVVKAAVEVGAGAEIIDNAMVGMPAAIRQELRAIALLASHAIAEPNWKCPEHDKFFAKCRYCVAAGVAAGPLQPSLLAASGAMPHTIDMNTLVSLADAGLEMEEILKEQDESGVSEAVAVFAKAATWRRRLVMDGE